ncbi:MAG: undecaprenyldiphospho-muramoylpentapeptide beta-N-acetylglucosaminyltransferase [Bacteroidales bacterium]|nr:undecaprenyldiphospho-muramoylpentapeptide beta-N-acetylglucosaminyltransferase [Bacteroidales bacterium]
MPQHKTKILISGGGTGGHVFPAIAIAESLKKIDDTIDILFVGAKGRIEMERVPLAGFPIVGLWISGFQRSLSLKNLLFPFKLLLSLIKAGKIIRKFKPDVVVGVGGYASGPTGKMAARKKIPLLLQEQNSFPGITNKLLAAEAEKICVAYPGMEKYFPKEKIIISGNPIRRQVIQIDGKKELALQYFELDKNKPVILIVGGSQGALSINEAIEESLELFAMKNIQLIWQTGKLFEDLANKAVLEKLNGNKKMLVKVKSFITKMDLAYAAADLVISRAGAIAISELCAVGKPCIFVPLPTAAEDHQTHNAKALESTNAAIHLVNAEAKEKLGKLAIDLLGNETRMQTLAENIKKLAITNSADIIAEEILKMVKEHKIDA